MLSAAKMWKAMTVLPPQHSVKSPLETPLPCLVCLCLCRSCVAGPPLSLGHPVSPWPLTAGSDISDWGGFRVRRQAPTFACSGVRFILHPSQG